MATNGYVFCGITTVVVVSRILYKVFGTAVGMGADDWSILVAHLFAIALTVVGTYGLADHGMGRDIWTISFDEITQVLQFLYMVELFYFLSISLLKMSILFFYMRIFTTPGTTKILWGTQAFNVLFTLSCCFAIIFQCTPVDYAWTRWDGEHQGTCLEFNPIVWTVAVVGIALDLWMLAIPLHTLRGLNLGTRKKIGVALMFIVGTLYVQIWTLSLQNPLPSPSACPYADNLRAVSCRVTIVSIFRLATLTKFANSQNITWDSWEASFVSGIEIGLGTICASMPTARAAFSRCLSVMRTRTDSQYHFSQNNMKQGSGKRSRQAGEEIDMTHRSRTWSQLESTESGDIDEESLVQRKDGELSVKNYSGVVERQVPF